MIKLSASSSSASNSRKLIRLKEGVVKTKIIANQQHKYNLALTIGTGRARVQGLHSPYRWHLILPPDSVRIELN